MKIIHLSNVTNYKNGGGIFEVVSNIFKSMDALDNVTGCCFVEWANFPYLLKKSSDLIIHRHGLWTINSILLLIFYTIFKIPFVLHHMAYIVQSGMKK